jgi:hypothetical protein
MSGREAMRRGNLRREHSSSLERARTIATASLSTDSPKMSEFSFGSAPVLEKMHRVATGSTAEMSAPKAQASSGVSRPLAPPSP